MNKSFLFGLSGALLATALLSQGCRTIQSRDGRKTHSFDEPVTAPLAVSTSDDSAVEVSPPAVPQATTEPRAVPLSAEVVGTPGSYIEFVVPEEGEGNGLQIENIQGIKASAGTRVAPPPPVRDAVVAPKPAPAGSGFYVVQSGDILGRIAQKHGVSVKALLEANNLSDPNKIRVGQKLRIPEKSATNRSSSGTTSRRSSSLPAKEGFTIYTVKSGDILGRIAIAHKTTQKAILEANGLSDGNRIRAGQQLYIPVGVAALHVQSPKVADKVDSAMETSETSNTSDNGTSGDSAGDQFLSAF